MRSRILALAAVLFSVLPILSGDLVWRNPTTGPFFWWEISVTRDAFYIPSNGAFLRSTNAHDWTLRYPDETPLFFSIAQSPDKWIAAALHSGGPALFVSTNGVDFKFLKNVPFHLYKIVYGQGRFVAAGLDLFWSDNGVDWTPASGVASTDSVFNGDLIFANGLFLRCVAANVYTSTDGKKWTGRGAGGRRLSYHNGLYAIASNGEMSFSTNGLFWERQTVPSIAPVAMAVGSKGVVAASDSLDKPASTALFSADKTNWITFTLPFSNRPWDLKFINDEYVMVGDGGLIAYSSDGTNWTKNSPVKNTVHLSASARSDDRIVAVGDDGQNFGAAIWSSDGLTWQNADVTAPGALLAIACQNRTFVAVGADGHVVVSTNNADSWFAPPRIITSTLYDLTTSPAGFVAVGRTNIFSADGIHWEVLPNPGITVSYIAYGNGLYVATGSGNFDEIETAISRDLIHWELLPIRAGGPVQFGNGRFVLGGFVSFDGTNWVRRTAPGPYNLKFSEGVFTGIGSAPNEQGYVSVDGLSWHRLFEMPQLQSRMARYFGRFLVFTSYSGVAEVDNFGILNLEAKPDGTFDLTPIHPGRFTSEIEGSRDFLSWESVTNFTSPTFPSDAQRFFRMKLN